MVHDILGQRFGRLTVTERRGSNKNGRALWLAKCDCGKEIVILGNRLLTGNTQSCGCFYRDSRPMCKRTHGDSRKRLYSIWKAMRKRCRNPKEHHYFRYGGRGISVCKEWNDFEPFREWALKNGYQDNLTIDRTNNDGNYEPSNCRWVSAREQSHNTSRNIFLEFQGRTQIMADWCRELNISPACLCTRYKKGLRGKELFKPTPKSLMAGGCE